LTVVGVLLAGSLACLVPRRLEARAFQQTISQVPRPQCRYLTETVYTDSGQYSGSVRLVYVSVVVGQKGDLDAYARRLKARLPADYEVSQTVSGEFREANFRAPIDDDAVRVLQVTRLRAIRWSDAEHWFD